MKTRFRFGLICLVLAGSFLVASSGPRWTAAQAPASQAPGAPSAKKRVNFAKALEFATTPREKVLKYEGSGLGRGYYQRTFLDVHEFKGRIEIAFVIDATISMEEEIESLKEKLGLLVGMIRENVTRAGKDVHELSVAVVVYYDLNTFSPPANPQVPNEPAAVRLVTPRFIDVEGNKAGLNQVLDSIRSIGVYEGKGAGGKSDFPEQVDRGLYRAMTELDWTSPEAAGQNGEVTRLIILAGDAPPHPDTATGGALPPRKYSDIELINLAQKKGITIHSVLCETAREWKIDPKTQPDLRRWREFTDSLARGTKGKVLDLDQDDTIDTITKDADTNVPALQAMKEITWEDLKAALNRQNVRIVVLPPVPLAKMTFDTKNAEVDLSVKMITSLGQFPGISRPPLCDVERDWGAARSDEAPSTDEFKILQRFAQRSGANFVLHGSVEQGVAGVANRFRGQVYEIQNGKLSQPRELAPAAANTPQQLAREALLKLAEAVPGSETVPGFQRIALLKDRLDYDPPAADVQEGELNLQKAMQYDAKDAKGRKLIEQAQVSLQKTVEVNPNDAWALFLLANCHFNLEGRQSVTAGKLLTQAYESRERLKNPAQKLEVQADYALLVANDPAKAVEIYEEMARTSAEGRPQSALRALWMLSGIYLGDWGVRAYDGNRKNAAQRIINVDKARNCILTMLLNWPESPEAKYYDARVDKSQMPVEPQEPGGKKDTRRVEYRPPLMRVADYAREPRSKFSAHARLKLLGPTDNQPKSAQLGKPLPSGLN